MPSNFKKRRHGAAVNKNDLKISRNEKERTEKAAWGSLRSRFPQVRSLEIDLRMESPTSAVLLNETRSIGGDDSLNINVTCEGGCSGGVFLLAEAVVAAIEAGQEERDGMGLCQRPSYRDPNLPCSTKFYYQVRIS